MAKHAEFDCDVLVIGGGIAGVSAAAELSRDARVVLVEKEPHLGYHATGRSAAILAQNYGETVVQALTYASEAHFVDGSYLSSRGLVRIGRPDQMARLNDDYDRLCKSFDLEFLNPSKLQARIPFLRSEYAAGGYLNPHAQDIDVDRLLQDYARQAKSQGAAFLQGQPVETLNWQDGRWCAETSQARIYANVVVNGAGAWADEVASLAGVAPLGLQPLRRSAMTMRPPENLDLADLPMVVDADEEFFIKPEGGLLMASPADETPESPRDSRPDEMDLAVCADRIERAFDISIRRIEHSWSGLRTFAPDQTPICGFDASAPSFFWLAGQGGSGVQTAPALARLTHTLVSGTAPDDAFLSTGLDARILSPERLQKAA